MSRNVFLAWVVGLSLVASTIVAQDSNSLLQQPQSRFPRQSGQPQPPQPQPNMKMVSIEVVFADYVAGKSDESEKSQSIENPTERLRLLEKQGLVGSVARIRLSTLDQLPAMVQIGEKAPVITGRTRIGGFFGGSSSRENTGRENTGRGEGSGGTSGGGSSGPSGAGFNSIFSMQNIGTMVSVTPRIEDNGTVVVTLELERSRLVPPPAEGPSANEEGIPRTSTVTARTTVRVPPGQTVMVSGARTSAKEESGELLIMVSASVVEAESAKPTGTKTSAKQLKVYTLAYMKADSASESISRILNTTDLRVAVDSRTNSIIASGSDDALGLLEALLRKLDAAP